MEEAQLVNGLIYEGKTKPDRKILGFFIIRMGRAMKPSKSAVNTDVKFVWVDSEGNELNAPRFCSGKTFAKWAIKPKI